MRRLMYSKKDDTPLTREMLEMIPTPSPLGPRHRPYSFFEFVNKVIDKAQNIGMEITAEEYCVNKSQMQMFGTIGVTYEQGPDGDFEMVIGVRGSHDRTIPRGICIGSNVIVCSNLCFGGDLGTMKTKQTLNIEERLGEFIDSAIDAVPQAFNKLERDYDSMKGFTMPFEAGDHLLVDMYRKHMLSAAQLGVAAKEWEHPTYDAHDVYGNSAWKLLNACTESLKPRGDNVNMFTVANRSNSIHNFVYNLVKEMGRV